MRIVPRVNPILPFLKMLQSLLRVLVFIQVHLSGKIAIQNISGFMYKFIYSLRLLLSPDELSEPMKALLEDLERRREIN